MYPAKPGTGLAADRTSEPWMKGISRKGCEVTSAVGPAGEPVTYIGIEPPERLPTGSEVYTLDRLGDLTLRYRARP